MKQQVFTEARLFQTEIDLSKLKQDETKEVILVMPSSTILQVSAEITEKGTGDLCVGLGKSEDFFIKNLKADGSGANGAFATSMVSKLTNGERSITLTKKADSKGRVIIRAFVFMPTRHEVSIS